MLNQEILLLSIKQVAEETGKSENTIRRWIKEGRLKAERQANGRYIVKREDLPPILTTHGSFLPFIHKDRLLTESQFDTWCQQHAIEHPSDDDDGLHIGGLYRTDDNGNSTSFLRFYADDTILSVGVTKGATAEQIARWLGKDHKYTSQGKYKRQGAQIAFTAKAGGVIVDYVGTIVEGRLCLESYSHKTRYRNLAWYEHEPVENLVP